LFEKAINLDTICEYIKIGFFSSVTTLTRKLVLSIFLQLLNTMFYALTTISDLKGGTHE